MLFCYYRKKCITNVSLSKEQIAKNKSYLHLQKLNCSCNFPPLSSSADPLAFSQQWPQVCCKFENNLLKKEDSGCETNTYSRVDTVFKVWAHASACMKAQNLFGTGSCAVIWRILLWPRFCFVDIWYCCFHPTQRWTTLQWTCRGWSCIGGCPERTDTDTSSFPSGGLKINLFKSS